MNVEFSLRSIKRVLLVIWGLLVLAGLLAEGWRFVLDERTPLSRFFSLSCEQNAPTWYSSSLLLCCALQLGLIATRKQQAKAAFTVRWWVLAAAFLYISMDETVSLHESASTWFDFGGFLYYGWVIPASVIVAIMGVSYLPFLAHLPHRTRWQFVLAGAIYVGGAIGVEFPLGYWTDLTNSKNLIYGLIDLVQESMEILGITLFLCALSEILAGQSGRLQITLMDRHHSPKFSQESAPEPMRIAS